MQTACVWVLGSAWLAAADAPAPAAPAASLDDNALYGRALVSTGDTARVCRALAKARRGEAVTVGVIGGSITQGAAASKPEFRYGERIGAWWRETFPKAKVEFVNAGIGATGSNFGALRARRDLLSRTPDFVVAEYAVNDGNTQASAETLEGIVRQTLALPNQPAVVLLFTMHRNGGNAQEWLGKVGQHYGLPMLSFRDALWPEIEADRVRWEDVEADMVHPNDRGHGYMASFVTRFLADLLKTLPADAALPAVKPVPAPLTSDLFEHVSLLEASDLKPVANQGWAYDAGGRFWGSDQPGSAIEFDVDGQVVLSMHYVVKGPMGRARVTVDGGSAKTLEGWFDQTWGGYRQTNEIVRGLAAGQHRVRVELLPDKADGSTGNGFRIFGLGTAGATPAP